MQPGKNTDNGHQIKQITGMTPIEKENDQDIRKSWAENIIGFLNNDKKWKYENTFRFRADLTKTLNGKVVAALDECLLGEDIGGFVGAYLFDNIEAIKESAATMKNIFSDNKNYEAGETTFVRIYQHLSRSTYMARAYG